MVYFDNAIDVLRLVDEGVQPDTNVQELLRDTYWSRAFACEKLQNYAEAVKDWDRAVEFSPPLEKPKFRAYRALSKLNTGQVADAVAEVTELRKLPGWDADQLYGFACVYAVASRKLAEEKQEYADLAMQLLNQAVKAGYKDHIHMKQDTDLHPLRDREDFKKLVVDLVKLYSAPKEAAPMPREMK